MAPEAISDQSSAQNNESSRIYDLNKDKAVSLLGALNNYVTFFMLSFISVFIPLAYTLSRDNSEVIEMLKILIVFIIPFAFPFIIYLNLRYIEYRSLYEMLIVQSLVMRIYSRSKHGQSLSTFITQNFDNILNNIIFTTYFNQDKSENYLKILQERASQYEIEMEENTT